MFGESKVYLSAEWSEEREKRAVSFGGAYFFLKIIANSRFKETSKLTI